MRFSGILHQPGAEKLGRAEGTPGLVGPPAGRRRRWPWRRRCRRRCCRVGVRQASHVQRANGLAVVRGTTSAAAAVGRRTRGARWCPVAAPPGVGRVGRPPSRQPGGRFVGRGHHRVTHRRVQGRDPEER